MPLTKYSEEQKPLEDFFQAKGLKTRNEMLDDVSPPLPPQSLYTNTTPVLRPNPGRSQRRQHRLLRRRSRRGARRPRLSRRR